MPHCDVQLQNLAPNLTRLELLRISKWAWDAIPSMSKLCSLASGCTGKESVLRGHMCRALCDLSYLTELQLAFAHDVKIDLSYLKQLKVLLRYVLLYWGSGVIAEFLCSAIQPDKK